MNPEVRKFYLLFAALLAGGYLWVAMSWYSDLHLGGGDSEFTICVMKTTTGIPCPSCGATRTAMSLIKGDWAGAFWINPLGILLAAGLLFGPVLLIIDMLMSRRFLYNTWESFQKVISRRKVLIVFGFLIALNWIWNITKGL
jgi:hypothetical protein